MTPSRSRLSAATTEILPVVRRTPAPPLAWSQAPDLPHLVPMPRRNAQRPVAVPPPARPQAVNRPKPVPPAPSRRRWHRRPAVVVVAHLLAVLAGLVTAAAMNAESPDTPIVAEVIPAQDQMAPPRTVIAVPPPETGVVAAPPIVEAG